MSLIVLVQNIGLLDDKLITSSDYAKIVVLHVRKVYLCVLHRYGGTWAS